MDPQNPLRSVAPTVEADVLAVLASTHLPLTGLTVERLAGRSHAQVRTVLHRLAGNGLVDAERIGNAVQYCLNREHVLAPAVADMLDAARLAEGRLRQLAAGYRPPPMSIAMFGSFARRDGEPGSDVDILLVRPQRLDGDDPRWVDARLGIAQHVERWTGNRCQIVEMSPAELQEAVRREEPLVASLRRDGRDIFGKPLAVLLQPGRGTGARRESAAQPAGR